MSIENLIPLDYEDRRKRSRESHRWIMERLAAAGIYVEDIHRLGQEGLVSRATPILLALLPEINFFPAKDNVIMAIQGGKLDPGFLVQEFRDLLPYLNEHGADSYGWRLGAALADHADGTVFDDIVELIQDRRYGKARQMLTEALTRVKKRRVEAIPVLIELLGDEQMEMHALFALGKLKAVEALPQVRQSLTSNNRAIRAEAKKALRKIEKAAGIAPTPPDTALLQRVRDMKRRAARVDMEGLEEASMNFDEANVASFLRGLSPLFHGGIPEEDLKAIESVLEKLKVDQTVNLLLTLNYEGEEVPLLLQLFKDDEGEIDLGFFGSAGVAEAIQQEMAAWSERQ
jgi:hypothetical protein